VTQALSGLRLTGKVFMFALPANHKPEFNRTNYNPMIISEERQRLALVTFKYSDALLDIFDHASDFDRDDLQSAIEAQIHLLEMEVLNQVKIYLPPTLQDKLNLNNN
jgi:hypothetical protein